jgi:predicted MFS family arabinose efflux permease
MSSGYRFISLFLENPETTAAAISGSVTESLAHPRKLKLVLPYLMKALIVGFLLAKFVNPAIAEKLKLSQKETLAISFITGFAGLKIINIGEKAIDKELERRIYIAKNALQSITTDSSKTGDDS